MFEKIKEKLMGAKLRIAALSTSLLALVGSAAAEVNWTNITSIIEGVATIFPAFISLIEAAIPIIIVMAVVGFIVAFMDKILDLIKIK